MESANQLILTLTFTTYTAWAHVMFTKRIKISSMICTSHCDRGCSVNWLVHAIILGFGSYRRKIFLVFIVSYLYQCLSLLQFVLLLLMLCLQNIKIILRNTRKVYIFKVTHLGDPAVGTKGPFDYRPISLTGNILLFFIYFIWICYI